MGGFLKVVDDSLGPTLNPTLTPLRTGVGVAGAYTVNADDSGTFTPAGAGNSPWPMVTNGVKSYHIVEPTGNTNPVVSIITKQ